MTKEELIELSDLNREDNIKYISSEAQGIAITLDSDRYSPTLCKLERAYICGRRKSEEQITELERKLEQTEKDLTDYQFNYPKIKDLEKENAELKKDKKDLIFIRNQKAKCMCEDKEQLTKAKKILQTVLDKWKEERWILQSDEEIKQIENLMEQAEYFLKE